MPPPPPPLLPSQKFEASLNAVCPLLIPSSCTVLLSFVGLLPYAKDLWKPPLPPASQKLLIPTLICSFWKETLYPSVSDFIWILGAIDKNTRWLSPFVCSVGVSRMTGLREGRATELTAWQAIGISALQCTMSREETHNCSSPSTYLSAGWYEAIFQEEKKKKKRRLLKRKNEQSLCLN